VSLRRLLGAALLSLAQTVSALPEYAVKVVQKLPHSRTDWTQGLEIRADKLYQSTGQYGASKLQVFSLASGELLQQHALPDQYFGEGLTLLDDQLIQLTWRARQGLLYQASTLQPSGSFELPGEGWGATNNGEQLIYSDGTDQLHFVSPADWSVQHSISVRLQGRPVWFLNELEWTPDYLLANVWRRDWILMIDPATGEVIGRIDLAGLLPRSEARRNTNVLNGIARDPATGALWVTGKNWPWLYQIELIEKNALE